MSDNPFKRAQRRGIKARIALAGPSGSGKTMWALFIGKGLSGDGDLAVIDTEHGSASRYADLVAFDGVEMDEFKPSYFVSGIKAAESAGYRALIIDSLSHEWNGKGGALEQVDRVASKSTSGNKFTAWASVTPQHQEVIEAMLGCRMHLIATMRTKTEYVLDKDDRGKSVPTKVGLAPIQRDGVEYEFDILCNVTLDHELVVSKSRCLELTDRKFEPRDLPELVAILTAWTEGGEMPEREERRPMEPRAEQSSDDPFGGDEETPDVEETPEAADDFADEDTPAATGADEPVEAPAEPHSDGETVRKLMGAYGGVATTDDLKSARRKVNAAKKAGLLREDGTAMPALKAADEDAQARIEVVADTVALYENARNLQQWANAEETYTHHVNAKALRDGTEAMQRVTRARLVSYCQVAEPNHAESVRMEIDAARGAGNLLEFTDEDEAVNTAWDEYQARVAEPVKE